MSGVSIGDGKWYERCAVCGEFEDMDEMVLASHPEPGMRKPCSISKAIFEKLTMCPGCDAGRWKTSVKFGIGVA